MENNYKILSIHNRKEQHIEQSEFVGQIGSIETHDGIIREGEKLYMYFENLGALETEKVDKIVNSDDVLMIFTESMIYIMEFKE